MLSDVSKQAEAGEIEFLFEAPEYGPDDLIWKDDEPKDTAGYLREVINLLGEVDEDSFTHESVKEAVWEYASEVGRGNVLWPMRFALSGQKQSPGPFMIAAGVGKQEAMRRLETAIECISDAD